MARDAKWLVNYGQHANGKKAAAAAAAALRRKGWYVVRSGGMLYIENDGARPWSVLDIVPHVGPTPVSSAPDCVAKRKGT